MNVSAITLDLHIRENATSDIFSNPLNPNHSESKKTHFPRTPDAAFLTNFFTLFVLFYRLRLFRPPTAITTLQLSYHIFSANHAWL